MAQGRWWLVSCLLCVSVCLGQEIDRLLAIEQWATTGDASEVVILAGNSAAHLDTVYNALQRADNPHLPPNQILTVAASDTTLGDICSTLQEELPWTVVFVSHAETLSTFQVNELLSVFRHKQRCSSPEHKWSSDCRKLLVVLSTDICESEVVLHLRDLEASVNEADVTQTCTREIRSLWTSGLVYQSHRQILNIIYGPFEAESIQSLIQYQTTERAKGASVETHSVELIDPAWLDHAGFIGHTEVVVSVKRALNAVKAGLKVGDGPLIFLFAGLPGTGKTFLSQLIARAYNGRRPLSELEKEGKYMMIDMGNYQDERAVDGFVDPSPGLQGEGLLSSLFQKETRTVVVLDEVEKAHPSLLKDMLLPVLDNNDGHVQKKKTGERFSTRDAIFVLTTNCFDQQIANALDYDQAVQMLTTLFTDPSARCLSAHPSSTNPFAWGPLWRRLQAGQALATSKELFAFLPPTVSDVKQKVRLSLEALNSAYKSGHGTRIKSLFYTKKALKSLESVVLREFKKGTMANIAPKVENLITTLILKVQGSDPRDGVAVLYINRNGKLDIILYSVETNTQQHVNRERVRSTSETSSVSSISFKTSSRASQSQQASLNTEQEVEQLHQPVVASATAKELSLVQSSQELVNSSMEKMREWLEQLSLMEYFELLIFWSLMSLGAYWFVLPFVKSLVIFLTTSLLLVAMFNPNLAAQLVIGVFNLASFVLRFLSSSPFRGLVTLLVLFAPVAIKTLWRQREQVRDFFVAPKSTDNKWKFLALKVENRDLKKENEVLRSRLNGRKVLHEQIQKFNKDDRKKLHRTKTS